MRNEKERTELTFKVLSNLQDTLELLKDQRTHPAIDQIYRKVNRAFEASNRFLHEHIWDVKESNYYFNSKTWRKDDFKEEV
jgi:hypothetical protein